MDHFAEAVTTGSAVARFAGRNNTAHASYRDLAVSAASFYLAE
jgi:hypothetical protein